MSSKVLQINFIVFSLNNDVILINEIEKEKPFEYLHAKQKIKIWIILFWFLVLNQKTGFQILFVYSETKHKTNKKKRSKKWNIFCTITPVPSRILSYLRYSKPDSFLLFLFRKRKEKWPKLKFLFANMLKSFWKYLHWIRY